MNALEGIVENLDNATFTSIESRINPINDFCESVNNYFKNIQKAVEIYERTGVPPKCNFDSWETFEVLEDTRQHNSSKENVAPNENVSNKNNTGGRSHKNSLRQTTRNQVKKEKMSIIDEEKGADNDQMPAPSQPAPKRTKQQKAASQLQIKEEKLQEELTQEASDYRDSVIIQEVAVPVIDLIDSDGTEGATKKGESEMPATRASRRTKRKETKSKIQIKKEKIIPQDTTVTVASITESDVEVESAKKKTETKQIKQSKKSSTKSKESKVKKRTRSRSSSDAEENIEKRAKSDSENLQNEGLDTKTPKDATFISKSPVNKNLNTAITMNTTVIVEKPKFVSNSNKLKASATIDDLMTDDESDDDHRNITKVVTKNVAKAPKQGQCVSTTSKKTVESSENMGPEDNTFPVRITRTKTRAQAKEQEEVNVVETPNTCTPVLSKHIPKLASTVIKKTIKTPQSSSNSKLISAKFGSELKASQAEFREREKKRREKAKEESALIQAQLEERLKKKEKQLKVQQQREAWEKENQRQKEELVKRKMLKIQAIEEKKKELSKPKKKEEVRTVQQPIYMTTKPPLLPTDDCYDSDDERNKGRPLKEVLWAKSSPLRETLVCMMAAGDTVKNSFFSRQAETPDLQEIFVYIRPEKLKRTSSAIWKKAPRYTMMPVLDQHYENSEDDSD